MADDELVALLSNPVRRELIARLWEGEKSVGELAQGFEIALATVSWHLKQLRAVGLLAVRTEGNLRWYSLQREALRSLHDRLFVGGFGAGWLPSDEVLQPQPDTIGRVSELRQTYESTWSATLQATPQNCYRHFVEPECMERWCGNHVSANPIDGGKFSFSVALGLRVEAEYVRLVPGALVIIHWFGGKENTLYVLMRETRAGTHLEVRQLALSRPIAQFLDRAWEQYFPRLCAAITAQSGYQTK